MLGYMLTMQSICDYVMRSYQPDISGSGTRFGVLTGQMLLPLRFLYRANNNLFAEKL
jgi:hypothetical protein